MGLEFRLQKLQGELTNTFHVLTMTLLSLLIPLSFLLVARLSCANFIFSTTGLASSRESSFLFSVILYTNPALLYLLISIITVAALFHSLTGKLTASPSSENQNSSNSQLSHERRNYLYPAWIIICAMQVCVGLGIEGSIEAGIDGNNFGVEKTLLSVALFFLGLHETMMYWSREVVRPVVDDTIYYGEGVKCWMVERVAMGMEFGGLCIRI